MKIKEITTNRMRNPQIEEIIKNCFEEYITPMEAIDLISSATRGIFQVKYSPPNKGLTINGYSIPSKGLSREELERLAEISSLAYLEAESRKHLTGINPGRVELGQQRSTKHYRSGFNQYCDTIRARYAGAVA